MRDLFSIQPPSHRPDRTRRRLLSLAVMAAMMAGLSRTAWAQEPGKVARTLRSLRIWWENITREPDAGDEEAKDTERFMSPLRPNPRTWSDGGITIAWIGHTTFLIKLEGTTILTDPDPDRPRLQRQDRL